MGFPLKAPLVAREVDGDLVLHDRRSGSMHRLNAVAGFIWQLCDGVHDPAAITSEVAAVFGKRPADVAQEVDNVLARFTDIGLIYSTRSRGHETELLLRCVRTAIGTERARPISDLLGEIDWNSLVQTALQHGVMPLLYRSLAANWREAVPTIVLDRLRSHYHENVRGNRALLRELLELLALFEACRIRALPLRGPVLAMSIYGDLTMRQFEDLDIFVPAAQIAGAKNMLTARGYKFRTLGDTDALADSSDGRVSVDLQWALAPGVWRFPIDLEQLWGRLVPVSLGNATVWQPNPADHALILCAHGAKHCWSSLKWIIDVAAFTRMHKSSLDWKATVDRARSLGGERQLLLAMRLAGDILDADVPVEVVRRITADPAVAALATELRQRLFVTVERPTHQGSYGFIEGGLLYIRTRERIRDKIPYAFELVRYPFKGLKDFITPNVHDRAVIALPKSLAFLYYLVRPLRLTGNISVRFMHRWWTLKVRR
jgi:hypothetical protein